MVKSLIFLGDFHFNSKAMTTSFTGGKSKSVQWTAIKKRGGVFKEQGQKAEETRF